MKTPCEDRHLRIQNLPVNWCGGWDLNPRTPAGQPPQGCAFGHAWQPPLRLASISFLELFRLKVACHHVKEVEHHSSASSTTPEHPHNTRKKKDDLKVDSRSSESPLLWWSTPHACCFAPHMEAPASVWQRRSSPL